MRLETLALGIVVSWLLANDININILPPLKYNHGTDQTLISHEDHNKVIRQEIVGISVPLDGMSVPGYGAG